MIRVFSANDLQIPGLLAYDAVFSHLMRVAEGGGCVGSTGRYRGRPGCISSTGCRCCGRRSRSSRRCWTVVRQPAAGAEPGPLDGGGPGEHGARRSRPTSNAYPVAVDAGDGRRMARRSALAAGPEALDDPLATPRRCGRSATSSPTRSTSGRRRARSGSAPTRCRSCTSGTPRCTSRSTRLTPPSARSPRPSCTRSSPTATTRSPRIRAFGRKGWLPAFRDATLFKTAYAFGLRRNETRMLDAADFGRNPHGGRVRRVRPLPGPVRQGQEGLAAQAAQRVDRVGVDARHPRGVVHRGPAAVRHRQQPGGLALGARRCGSAASGSTPASSPTGRPWAWTTGWTSTPCAAPTSPT